MNVDEPTVLLGGLTPTQFMRRHWQKKPLLVRQAWPGVEPPLSRAELFELAGDEDVESRLLVRRDASWRLRHGPFNRRAIPSTKQADWTLLVQGLDLHVPAAHAMRSRFRFVPEARLDDVMMSYASDGGGVGPHLDSYDVFLLQVQGRRRWRVGPVADRSLVPGLPVKILANFEPWQEWLLEPGDMLYVPPLWGHDGVAEGGDCMTCSIGFRAPAGQGLARELLQQIADEADDENDDGDAEAATAATSRTALYRDPAQPATNEPGRLPEAMRAYAAQALHRLLGDPLALDRALGSVLTEPKPKIWFDAVGEGELPPGTSVVLDRRTRMLYDKQHVYINGEAFRAGGRDARLMHELADTGRLGPAALDKLSADAQDLLRVWIAAGWLQAGPAV